MYIYIYTYIHTHTHRELICRCSCTYSLYVRPPLGGTHQGELSAYERACIARPSKPPPLLPRFRGSAARAGLSFKRPWAFERVFERGLGRVARLLRHLSNRTKMCRNLQGGPIEGGPMKRGPKDTLILPNKAP